MENEKLIDFSSDSVKDIIKYSPSEKTDFFFFGECIPKYEFFENMVLSLNENILILLPNRLLIPDRKLKEIKSGFTLLNFDMFSTQEDFDVKLKHTPVLCFADVRLFNSDGFWRFAHHISFSRFVVLFANCADLYEYGYRQSFSLIAEYRASQKDYIHLSAFFTGKPQNADEFACVFGSSKVIAVNGQRNVLPVEFVATLNVKEKYRKLANECKLNLNGRTVVLFSTRRELSEFIVHLKIPVENISIIHGGVSSVEMKNAVNNFYSGNIGILLATKSVFATSLFLECDRVFYCGLPFSTANLFSAFSLLKDNKKVECFYCNEDVLLMYKLCSGAADYFAHQEKNDFLKKRLSELDKIIGNIPKERE